MQPNRLLSDAHTPWRPESGPPGLRHMPDCQDCKAGPAGIAGHDRLFSETMGAGRMHFRCRACDLVWVRLQDDAGEFVWSRSAGKLYDTDTPGRLGSAPP